MSKWSQADVNRQALKVQQGQLLRQAQPLSKFRSRKTTLDGVTFDSAAEAKRYVHLKALEKIGQIRQLRLQPRYPVVVNGVKVCDYVADFEYVEGVLDEVVTEDVKSAFTRTMPVYRLKAKLFTACYGRTILETR